MQRAVNYVDSGLKTGKQQLTTTTTDIKKEVKEKELEDLVNEDMEQLPTISLSTQISNVDNTTATTLTTATTISTTTTTTNALRKCLENKFDSEFTKNHSNVEVMSVTSSSQVTPSKKKRHRMSSINYTTTRHETCRANNNTTTTTSSSSSSTSEISVINGVANNTINNGYIARPSTSTSAIVRDQGDDNSFAHCCDETKQKQQQEKLQIPPETLSIIAYGDQYYSELSDSPNSEATTPLAPSTTPSMDNSSHTSSTISTPNADKDKQFIQSKHQSIELLQWKDMPKYLQFNPYVLKGYRPLQPFRGCLLSLFYWHNETVNILTHAIPIFYILATVPALMPWEQEFRFLSFCHLLGSVAPWCGSFLYHLFMNIENGESIYYRLLKLDMVGIWVSQSFGALPLVTATTFCFTFKWKWAVIISYCLLSLWGLYKALTATSPWGRRLCFALPFCMRSTLTVLRTFGLVGVARVALSHVYLQVEVDGVSILGGVIGAMRIPEKWFPGLVDYYLNSHNIMHVLVVVAVYSMHKATLKDFEWMSTASCEEFNNTTNKITNLINSHVEL